MCPATKTWQEKVFDFTSKLVWDHGVVASISMCSPPAKPGRVMTNRTGTRSMAAIRGAKATGSSWTSARRIRAEKPHAFTTEEICEIYLDSSTDFDPRCDSGRLSPPVMCLPLFTAVYHDYAIQYGSDCGLSATTDHRGPLGRAFCQGAKATLSEMARRRSARNPDRPPTCGSGTLIRQGRQEFLLEGQWLRPPAAGCAVGAGHAGTAARPKLPCQWCGIRCGERKTAASDC